jgi:hypothetical protein
VGTYIVTFHPDQPAKKFSAHFTFIPSLGCFKSEEQVFEILRFNLQLDRQFSSLKPEMGHGHFKSETGHGQFFQGISRVILTITVIIIFCNTDKQHLNAYVNI